MASEPFRDHLNATRPFGCLSAALLGLGMSFVAFVGSVMGDCDPGPGCHDNDGAVIGYRLLITALIVLSIGAAFWFLSAVMRMLLQQRIGRVATNLFLTVVTLLIVWFGFAPAMELLLATTS